MDASAHFKGKKITAMGLGLLGGVGDIRYLAESGADIIATDLKSEADLAPSLAILKQYPNIRYTLGRHDLEDFRGRDLVIKAPSTPLDSIYIAEARKEGTPITMWAALFTGFAREAGAKIIGVTGTRGKTTVTAMISAIERAAGKHVVEGGNVRGTSLLSQLANVTADTVAVLELDSWKLQGFGEAQMSPDISVFTTFYPDHLNYYSRASERIAKMNLGNSERAKDESSAYKDDLAAYLADKANIFLYQAPEDTYIVGKQCAPILIEKYGEQIVAKTIVTDATKLPDTWVLTIPGLHNRYNAALALAAARESGVADEVSRAALAAFAGVPGRLEKLREVKGVEIYNDTTSTTPEATLAALAALGTEHTVIIVGGSDKNLELDALSEKLKEVKKVILLAGSGTERLRAEFPDAPIYDALAPAVADAVESTENGDTILFSPAFASFGMFKNEYDRGDQFTALVKEL